MLGKQEEILEKSDNRTQKLIKRVVAGLKTEKQVDKSGDRHLTS